MKKFLLTFLFLQALVLTSLAQEVRLNAIGLYTFEENFNSYYNTTNYYTGTIKDGMTYGLGLEVLPAPHAGVELIYFYQKTNVDMNWTQLTPQSASFDVNMNYMLLGGTRYLRAEGSMLEGFFGLNAGVAWVNAKNESTGNTNSATKFGWGIKAGANIWVSDKVAIKLQGQMLSAVQAAGGALYFGTGGAGAGLSLESSIYQWGLGGGLVFNLRSE